MRSNSNGPQHQESLSLPAHAKLSLKLMVHIILLSYAPQQTDSVRVLPPPLVALGQ